MESLSTNIPPTTPVSLKKKNAKMVLYRHASPGYWVAFLVPLAIYLADQKFQNQSFYAIIILLYNSLLLTSIHYLEFNLTNILPSLKKLNVTLFLLVVVYNFMNGGVFHEYFSYAALNFTFPFAFHNLIKHYPMSFTFGEGMLVTSAFVYNFWVTSQDLPFPPSKFQEIEEPIMVTMFVQMAFFGTIILLRVFLVISRPWRFFALEELFCIFAKGTFVALITRLSNPTEDVWFLVFWTIQFFFGFKTRITFLCFWIAMVLIAAIFTVSINYQQRITTTVHRKFFHFLISLVYFPAIFHDFNLIYFCSVIVLYALILLEAVRMLQLEIFGINFGEKVDSLVNRFRDDRDGGRLILTPIYLLAGCSAPIWLTGLYYKNDNNNLTELEMAGALSGVLSIGVGDMFASIVGSTHGVQRWPGTRKTILGTTCSILSQLLCVILFCVTGAIPFTVLSFAALLISSVVNALLEAFTDQIDNLVVPLTAFNVVLLIKYFYEVPTS